MSEIERILSLLVNTALNSKTKKDKPALLVKEFAGKFEDLIKTRQEEAIAYCEEETRLEKEVLPKGLDHDDYEQAFGYNQAISDTKDKFNKLKEGKE